jgi:hypothetical protein
VDVDQAAVAEVAVAPDALQQDLAAEHPAGAGGQLDQQLELGLGEVDLVAGATDHALVGDDLEVAEPQVGAGRVAGAGPAQQRPDAGRQLLGRERFGEVVVGAGFEPGDDVVGVGASRDHDDRHVGRLADLPADLEPVEAGEHDVDQHHVGRLALEGGECFFAGLGLLDCPALIFECELDRGADALVVFNGQDASGHEEDGASSSGAVVTPRPAREVCRVSAGCSAAFCEVSDGTVEGR